jgi:hypothetical protein
MARWFNYIENKVIDIGSDIQCAVSGYINDKRSKHLIKEAQNEIENLKYEIEYFALKKIYNAEGSELSKEDYKKLFPRHRRYKLYRAKINEMVANRVCYIDPKLFLVEVSYYFFYSLNNADLLDTIHITVFNEPHYKIHEFMAENIGKSQKNRATFRTVEHLYSKKILNDRTFVNMELTDEMLKQLKKGLSVSLFTEDTELRDQLHSLVSTLDEKYQSNLKTYTLNDIVFFN